MGGEYNLTTARSRLLGHHWNSAEYIVTIFVSQT